MKHIVLIMAIPSMWLMSSYGWGYQISFNLGPEQLLKTSGVHIKGPRCSVEAAPVNLPSTRSRPFICDWAGNGYPHVLIGTSDGKLHLYQSIPQPGDVDKHYDADFPDFASLANYCQQLDCGRCGKADCTGDGNVDLADLKLLTAHWLENAKY